MGWHAKVAEQISKNEYPKAAKKDMVEIPGLPVDAPDFERSKNASAILSDLQYKKDMPAVTEQFKGYQTMDPATHPVITKGKKAAEITSEKAYREEYHDEKALVYYPVHITEGYDSVKKTREATGLGYKKDWEADKIKCDYKITESEYYKTLKDHEITKDRLYKEDYEATKHENKIPADNLATVHAKNTHLQSDAAYAAEAKKDMETTHVPADGVGIKHAMDTQPLASHNEYKADYNDNVRGTGRGDPANSFPEHKHMAAVAAQISNKEYQKQAIKEMNEVGGLPADIPDIQRAKNAAAALSDREYKKSLADVNADMRGYQTMDPQDHPVVTKRKKDQEVLSTKLYHEEYEDEKALVYYPVHITEGYGEIKKTREATGPAYKADYKKDVQKNYHNYAETE